MPAVSISEPNEFIGKDPAFAKKQHEDYRNRKYHQPIDEYDPSWDLSGAIADLAALAQLGWNVAMAPTMPAYHPQEQFAQPRADEPCRSFRSPHIRQAADRVRGVARITPLIPVSSSDEWSHLWIKCENLQVIGAFKVRGAYNFLAALDPDVRAPRRGHLLLGEPRAGGRVCGAATWGRRQWS